jgi:CubicO group peptidase (beta-lactamase class C family)
MVVDADLKAQIEGLARRAMAEAPVPGLAVALVTVAGNTWSRAYGIAETSTGRAVEPRTVFEAASLTKPLVAFAALALVRDGVLDLDRPLDRYLAAAYLPAEERAASITTRMVLGHTTGLPNWRPRGKPLALLRDPGTRFGYSGEGYVYLQHALEHITGGPLHSLVAARVLAPLGMVDSTLIWRDELECRIAVGHSKGGAAVPKEKPARANAAWSLHTTAPDLARFVGAMLGTSAAGVASGTHPGAVDPIVEIAEAMLRPHTTLHGSLAWGLGWGLQGGPAGETLFWHWGDNFGYKAFVAGSCERGLGVVVLTNGNAGLAAAERLVRTVLPSLDEPFDALRDFSQYLS